MTQAASRICLAAQRLAQHAGQCLFVTLGHGGSPRARYMGALKVDNGMKVFLVCRPGSNKVREIARDPRAQVVLADEPRRRVVTLNGNAYLERSRTVRKKLFTATAPLKLYPAFNNDFGVIRFIPETLEYLDLDIRLEPVIIDLTGRRHCSPKTLKTS